MFGIQPQGLKDAIEAMRRAALALESEAVEQGSLDGFHGAADAFTASVSPRLWAGCAEYNRLGVDHELLRSQEDTLSRHKQEADKIVTAFRQKYERPGPRPAVGRQWLISVALLGLAAGLALSLAGVRMAAPHILIIAAVTVLLAIDGSLVSRLPAWVRDYTVYRRSASRSRRIENEIDRVRGRILAGMEHRHTAAQWVLETEKALAALYQLHRRRGEKAAQLVA